MALAVKNLTVNAGDTKESLVRSLSQEDLLEEGMVVHSSSLSYKIFIAINCLFIFGARN